MYQLIKVQQNVIGNDVVNSCVGRELHNFLEVKTAYKDWFPRRVEEYGFVKGQDYDEVLLKNELNLTGGRPSIDHIISIDMAKELSMVEKTAKGKQARQYFIACENALKKLSKQLSALDVRMKASLFYQRTITEGEKSGLAKKDAVLRAYSIAYQQTGYDFSDALPDKFKISEIGITTDKTLDKLSELFKDAIRAALKQGVKPSLKVIKNRKKSLNTLTLDELNALADSLVSKKEVDVDNSGRIPVFNLN